MNLAAAGGAPDGLGDTIVINATTGADDIRVTMENWMVTISGLAATVNISNFDANDRIIINGLAGDDVVDASGLGVGIQRTANGDDSNDILLGGARNDVLAGGAGDDVLLGGGGSDALDGGPGDNVVIQGPTMPQFDLLF